MRCEGFTDLNIHEIVDVDPSELGELLPTLFQKGRDIITLFTLQRQVRYW